MIRHRELAIENNRKGWADFHFYQLAWAEKVGANFNLFPISLGRKG